MIKLKPLIDKYSQFLKFCIVGLFNTLISVAVFNLLIYLGSNYLVATTIGYLAGLINAYLSSSKFVFRERAKLDTSIKFLTVYLSALVINLGLMYIMVDIGKIHPTIAQILVIGFNVVYNFVLNKLWTFRGK